MDGAPRDHASMRTISVQEARAIDADAVERLGMPSLLLMENAARAVADEVLRLGESAVILCGPGNNGGDGLAAARHLGRDRARLFLWREPDPQRAPDAALQLRILHAAGWQVETDLAALPEDRNAVYVDALFGTGLGRAVEGEPRLWIDRLNAATGRRLAVDVPSGLDADRGVPLGDAVCRADVTVTFEAAKHGMVLPSAGPYVGRLVVAPLGLP